MALPPCHVDPRQIFNVSCHESTCCLSLKNLFQNIMSSVSFNATLLLVTGAFFMFNVLYWTMFRAQVRKRKKEREVVTTRSASYVLLDRIGKGNFGSVYKARKTGTNKMFAIKKLEYAEVNADNKESLARELAILRVVKHANLVRLRDFYCPKKKNCKYWYLVMDLQKQDLETYLHQTQRRQPMRESDARRFAIQIADGLQCLHAQQPKIVHRDLKPANITMTTPDTNATLKIIDFGVSRVMDDALFANGSYCGSVFYMAPEVWWAMDPEENRAGVYSEKGMSRVMHAPFILLRARAFLYVCVQSTCGVTG